MNRVSSVGKPATLWSLAEFIVHHAVVAKLVDAHA